MRTLIGLFFCIIYIYLAGECLHYSGYQKATESDFDLNIPPGIPKEPIIDTSLIKPSNKPYKGKWTDIN